MQNYPVGKEFMIFICLLMKLEAFLINSVDTDQTVGAV